MIDRDSDRDKYKGIERHAGIQSQRLTETDIERDRETERKRDGHRETKRDIGRESLICNKI